MLYGLMVFLAGCSYGLMSIFVKMAFASGFQADELVGAQYLIGWIILAVLTLFFARQKVELKTAILLMLVGVTNGLTGVFYTTALESIPASIGIVLLFQFTWIGIVIEAVADRQWPSRGKRLAIPFLFIGTIFAGGITQGGLQFSLTGIILGLLSAVTFALYIFCSGRVATHIPVLPRTMWIVFGSLLLTFFIYPPHFLGNGSLTLGLSGYGLVLALLAAVVPSLLLAKGAPMIGPGMATILSSSELPVAVIVAAVFLRESVTGIQWLGVLIILMGVCVPYISDLTPEQYKRVLAFKGADSNSR